MIKIRNLNKYFNRNKPNEIHVINNANLTFPDIGLVCLLGPSGCGKTTLLNVISGLDKVQSGEIQFRDHIITTYHAHQWDMIRNRYFGYVFQNYLLLPDLTVYQNLEFVLKMFNLTNEEIAKRIDYALDAVGMVKYKKRRPTQLSGGQQQRVAIARALVKSPDVVVADEPTGNLDEKNTLQIMNIIKKISHDCLVVLVTHERRIAEFYADMIVELKDGQIISQRDVSQGSEFQSLYDTNIYLKDLKEETLDTEKVVINTYSDQETPKLNLNVIFKDNTFYISSNQDNLKIKFVDDHSEVKIVNANKPVIKLEDLNNFNYDLPKLEQSVKEKAAAIKYRDTFRMSLRYLSNLTKRKKLLFLVMFLSSILVVSGFIKFFSSTRVNEQDFMTDNRNLIEVQGIAGYDYADFVDLKAALGDATLLGTSSFVTMGRFSFDFFSQTRNLNTTFPLHAVLPLSVLEDPEVFMGELPTNKNDIVIDKWIADAILKTDSFVAAGGKYYEQLIGRDYYDNYGTLGGKIVGIVETHNPNIYASMENYQLPIVNRTSHYYGESSVIAGTVEVSRVTHYYSIADYVTELNTLGVTVAPSHPIANLTQTAGQILVSKSFFVDEIYGLGDDNHYAIEGIGTYTVIGITDNSAAANAYFHPDDLEALMLKACTEQSGAISVYSTNKAVTMAILEAEGLIVRDVYVVNRESYTDMTFNIVQYVISLVILGASLIFLYFIMRSSLISRVYEVGVYRALGVKKGNVYRLFVSEIVLISLFTSLLGVVAATLFIVRVNSLAPIEIIYYPWYVSFISLGFLFGCNLLIGLLPVFTLLRLTPSEILTKYDI
ncbi:MAG TPA: hypothetical protein DD618_01730 [Acholeplasmatales bacterium]|nr:hypothetical protein [Acholeplasmatales bacterium]